MRKKKNVSLLGKKLNSLELKKVKGGVPHNQELYHCVRKRKSDGGFYIFTTDSKEVAEAWVAVWKANSDWEAGYYKEEINYFIYKSRRI